MASRILVVDDEKLIRWSLRERLTQEGHEVLEAGDGAETRKMLDQHAVDLVLLDLKLPDADGLELLQEARHNYPEVAAIVITAHSTVDSAVEAMKLGAYDYVAKPFNMDDLALTVQRALDNANLRRGIAVHVEGGRSRFGLGNIVGEGRAMQDLKEVLLKIARSETPTVLLLGETGTGKDLFARAIHYESNRAERPFMNITCTALQENLLESELFGYEKGAFTDAKDRKKGLFELADGGTVFLDEIGDMSPGLQSKLLRVLEERTFRRIGGTQDIRVDVRIVAATNRDLEGAMQKGGFREDLYYRLATMPLVLPPLRERLDDVPRLARHFIAMNNREFHRGFEDVTPDALAKLESYNWPGNVREFRNVLERAMLLGAGPMIEPHDLLLGRRGSAPVAPDGRPEIVRLPHGGCKLADVEESLMRQALERAHWNQTRAAQLLGITRDQARYKMAKFGLKRPEED